MKHFLLIVLSLMWTMGATSCERGGTDKEKIEYTLQLTAEDGGEVSELSFGAEGGSATINVASNGAWQILPEQNAAEWLSASTLEGQNDGQITFTAAENQLQEMRMTNVDVLLNDKPATSFIITQSAAVPVYTMAVTNVTPDPANFGTEGGELTVTVETNSAWDYAVVPESDWISQTAKSENQLTLNIAEADYEVTHFSSSLVYDYIV